MMYARYASGLRWRPLATVLLVALIGILSATAASALTFVVNSTSDTGDNNIGDGFCWTGGFVGVVQQCTLRAAIEEANSTGARDSIEFSSSDLYDFWGRAGFFPATEYPIIFEPVDIDATTAPSWVAGQLPRVRIDGSNTMMGLRLGFGSEDSTVKGLAFLDLNIGVEVNGSDGAWIDSCSFGHAVVRNIDEVVSGNNTGIFVTLNAANTTIGARSIAGGGFSGHGNVISGNSTGVVVFGDDTHFRGNRIGTDNTGNRIQTQAFFPSVPESLGNSVVGILVENGEGLRVGDTKLIANGGFPPTFTFVTSGNVISGNGVGIDIVDGFGVGDDGMRIVANQIGTDIDGETDLGNVASGILATDADTDLTIGSSVGPNVIGGNGGHGIEIGSGGLASLTIAHNLIGVGSDGATAIGNDGRGIELGDGDPVVVDANVIGHNGSDGIELHEGAATGDVTIEDNWVGVNTDSEAVPNVGHGILVTSHSATIRNNVVGENADGIRLESDAGHSDLHGNYVGTDASGADLGNQNVGIRIVSLDGDNEIGGVGLGNTIGWNGQSGIVIRNSTDTNEIVGNFIGTNAAGDALPNDLHGIRVNLNSTIVPAPVVVGSDLATPSTDFLSRENRIGFNGQDGVTLAEDTLAVVRGNRMKENGQLAIDLNLDGATANDFGDVDLGANRSQNFPEMDAAASSLDEVTGELTIEYRVTSNPVDSNYPLTIDFYRADDTGLQPQRYLGSDIYRAADAGLQRTVQFFPTVALDEGEHGIVSIATDDSNRSSEVSAPITVPEPAGVLGLAAGVVGIAGLARSRRPGRVSIRA